MTPEIPVLTVLSTIAVVTVATVGTITFFFERRKSNLTSLNEVYHLLGDIRHREARKVLYGNWNMSSYEILGLDRPNVDAGASPEDLMSLAKDIVRSDLNHVGTLVRHRLANGKTIIKEYSWIIIKCWELLEDDIMKRRQSQGPTNHMKNFEDLKNKAMKYVEKNK
jgi:hypothetical protein